MSMNETGALEFLLRGIQVAQIRITSIGYLHRSFRMYHFHSNNCIDFWKMECIQHRVEFITDFSGNEENRGMRATPGYIQQ